MKIEIISLLIAIASASISLASFIFTRWSTIKAMEPHITGFESNSRNSYGYSISNKGGGPAVFNGVDYYLNDKKLPKDDFVTDIQTHIETLGFHHTLSITTLGEAGILGVSETINLFIIQSPIENDPFLANLHSNIAPRIVIRYKSVHGKNKEFDSYD